MRKQSASIFIGLMLAATVHTAAASSDTIALSSIDFERTPDAYQRGFKVANEVCRLCHSFKYIKYSNLLDIGISSEQVDALRGDSSMTDTLKAFMPDESADQLFGMVPPDLSVMAKARKGGPNYIYTLLGSYEQNAEGVIDNHLFPGIKMPDIMSWSIYTEATDRTAISNQIKDVSSFLAWAADPHEDARKAMGVWVIAYLIILTILFWFVKRRVWSRLPPATNL